MITFAVIVNNILSQVKVLIYRALKREALWREVGEEGVRFIEGNFYHLNYEVLGNLPPGSFGKT